MKHRLKVTQGPAYPELFMPHCSCGWASAWVETREIAQQHGDEHVNAASQECWASTDDHGPFWVNRKIGGQRIMVLIGCTCGWRVDPVVADPDDALVRHAAYASRTVVVP
jgi:hypothetical protein